MYNIETTLRTLTTEINKTNKAISTYKKELRGLKNNTVIDENKTVRWNREEVERKRAEIQNKIEELNNDNKKVYSQIHEEIINYIIQKYNMTYNKAKFIVDKVYDDDDCYNYHEIIIKSEFYADLIKDFLAIK